MGYKTIKVYLCGVQYYSRMAGFPQIIASMPRLPYVLRGIRRRQGPRFIRPKRMPITVSHLHRLHSYIERTASIANALMLKAAILTAFFGLLRVSEYTCPSSVSFCADLQLSPASVSINFYRGLAYLDLHASKTDPFRAGVTVRIGRTGGHLCPLLALLRYLVARPAVRGPLFMFSNGRFLTRQHVSALLKNCLGAQITVDTHSLRIGGASALAAAHTPDSIIQLLGRWRSDAFRNYIALPDDFVRDRNIDMAYTPAASRRWDPDTGLDP